MSIHYLRDLDEESYALLPDKRILITEQALTSIADYSQSWPTSPSAGRIYRKNYTWLPNVPDSWYVYIVEDDPTDALTQLHHPYKVELV